MLLIKININYNINNYSFSNLKMLFPYIIILKEMKIFENVLYLFYNKMYRAAAVI